MYKRQVQSRPFLNINDFLDIIAPLLPPPPGAPATAAPSNPRRAAISSMVDFKSCYFLLTTTAELGDVVIEVKSWFKRDNSGRNFNVFRRQMKRVAQYQPPPPEEESDDEQI